jgi:hypothetical protein
METEISSSRDGPFLGRFGLEPDRGTGRLSPEGAVTYQPRASAVALGGGSRRRRALKGRNNRPGGTCRNPLVKNLIGVRYPLVSPFQGFPRGPSPYPGRRFAADAAALALG